MGWRPDRNLIGWAEHGYAGLTGEVARSASGGDWHSSLALRANRPALLRLGEFAVVDLVEQFYFFHFYLDVGFAVAFHFDLLRNLAAIDVLIFGDNAFFVCFLARLHVAHATLSLRDQTRRLVEIEINRLLSFFFHLDANGRLLVDFCLANERKLQRLVFEHEPLAQLHGVSLFFKFTQDFLGHRYGHVVDFEPAFFAVEDGGDRNLLAHHLELQQFLEFAFQRRCGFLCKLEIHASDVHHSFIAATNTCCFLLALEAVSLDRLVNNRGHIVIGTRKLHGNEKQPNRGQRKHSLHDSPREKCGT